MGSQAYPAVPARRVRADRYTRRRGHRHARHPRRPGAQPQERHPGVAPERADRLHRPVRARASPRWRSTPSMPRASGATSSRSPPTPGSSSGRWRSRTSTSSRGSQPGHLDRPEVARPGTRGPRSGTITEVYDYLRVLFARVGQPHCHNCGRPIGRQTPEQIVDQVMELPEGHPVPGPRAGGPRPEGRIREAPAGAGPQGIRAGPDRRRGPRAGRADPPAEDATSTRSRSSSTGSSRSRTSAAGWPTRSSRRSSWPRASPRSRSTTPDGHEDIQTFSQKLACTFCGISFDELAPRNFSFNSPYGACQTCDGLGIAARGRPRADRAATRT